MKKTNLLTILTFLLFVGYVSQSCQKEATPEPEEFVATNATFADFATWTLESTKTGPGVKLGAAHSGTDSTAVRKIYFKDGQDPVNGTYPTGTVIVKHTTTSTGAEYTAMVKRGNSFNTTHGDWEWFMLESNGNIMTDGTGAEMRGANLMNGMCTGCHSNATTDYSFEK